MKEALYDSMKNEEEFHDAWAESTDVTSIDVYKVNEAVTSPELRYIRELLGDLKGKDLLDVGCGLGEASVYFALQGANVTSLDVSAGMLKATKSLGLRYQVQIDTLHCANEDMHILGNRKFDVIYAGNLLHHVDIESTLAQLKTNLKEDGVLFSWDPIAYNPIINVYRRIAKAVRTIDEHPLTLSDISKFKKNFGQVKTKYFWLTTLMIFILMFIAQRRDPNKERYWKKVIEEENTWKWLYIPLERFDKIILACFPFLKIFCWNVVIISKAPLHQRT